jgi:hypothetical protein
MTPQGHRRLKDELLHLLKVERPEVVRTVSWAASNGDRSENGDYIYGKKRLREVDRRIRFLIKRLDAAQVVEPQSPFRHPLAMATLAAGDEERPDLLLEKLFLLGRRRGRRTDPWGDDRRREAKHHRQTRRSARRRPRRWGTADGAIVETHGGCDGGPEADPPPLDSRSPSADFDIPPADTAEVVDCQRLATRLTGLQSLLVTFIASQPTVSPRQFFKGGTRRSERRSRSSAVGAGRNSMSNAAIATSLARREPSSVLRAIPSPASGTAAASTPSAPDLRNTRLPQPAVTRVSNRPAPAISSG